MQKPAGPDVMRASIMPIWHLGHDGRWMVMELALIGRERETPSHRWMRLGAAMHYRGTIDAAAADQY
jgi:hypothetical protein